ncbi:hypothetical protein FOCC_FOCC004175 [Frankliniella occidentalis]|uniref:Trypsin-1-like n=1 Tax=Frankliniella occidentalis TaxID=133901 RepID=A0A6J1SKP8_FRAOC|nr:trypsin-1-like [Frankliniella occidentalis]KAE8749008.1 hypothetical protein FOCC_FOCC004175 [Frankliniella occidentalis]
MMIMCRPRALLLLLLASLWAAHAASVPREAQPSLAIPSLIPPLAIPSLIPPLPIPSLIPPLPVPSLIPPLPVPSLIPPLPVPSLIPPLPVVARIIPIPARRPPRASLFGGGSPRIVNGNNTDIKQVPWQVALLAWEQFFCGGSAISATVVLTAAHCVHGEDTSGVAIRAGSSLSESGGQVVEVSEVIEHPQYDPNATDYDVCVFKLAESITFSASAQPVPIVRAGQQTPDGTIAIVSGWGDLKTGGPAATTLQSVYVPKVSDADCKKGYGAAAITTRMVCYGPLEGGKDSCQGDSGGPLVVNGVQVGVVSFGGKCAAPGRPGVYSNLADYELRDFITQEAGV